MERVISVLSSFPASPYSFPVPSIQVIYASTSGHTEYVVEQLTAALRSLDAAIAVESIRVEKARPDDLTGCDLLVLASGTWNTGGIEGQLNPHMHAFVHGAAKDVDLTGQHAAIIALGDDRYFYTCRSGEHLRHFVTTRGGEVWPQVLTIVNDPYGQEEKVRKWAKKLLDYRATLSPHAA